jgi:hypothetical protein
MTEVLTMVVNGKYNIKSEHDLPTITIEQIRQAATAGYSHMVIINGEYYRIAPEDTTPHD